MCLNLRRAYRTPYNKSKIRYKVVYSGVGGGIHPPFQYDHGQYRRRAWNTSDSDNTIGDFFHLRGHAQEKGFHVFISARDAKNYAIASQYRVYKVMVDDFLASGHWSRYKSETWRKMKFIKRVR